MLKLFARKDVDPQIQLKQLFDGYTLPTFPTIYLEALQQVRDPTSSAAALADVLALDPGLTVRLLGAVNSAAFGLRSPVKSVHHAVSMLGRGHIESMLISLATHSALPAEPCGGFEPHRFWRAAASARRPRERWPIGSTRRSVPSALPPGSSWTWRSRCCRRGKGRHTRKFSSSGTRVRVSFTRLNRRPSAGTTHKLPR